MKLDGLRGSGGVFRLAAGVKWRVWADGVVIFSPAAAQTSLLPVEAAFLLQSLAEPEGVLLQEEDRARLPVLDHLVRIAAIEPCP